MAQESHLRVVIDSRQALRDARAISTELQSIEKNGDYAAKSMNGASTAVREFAGYMAGIVTVGAAISKMDAYTGINNQLKLVTNSQVQLTGAMNETFAIAQRSRSSWESVTQVYQKLAMNAEAAGIAQKDIGRLTETISKGIALSGSSSEQAAAAIMQLGQSLGAGKLSGDEFNSVMENGYGVMQLLAKGMDVPIGQLKKLAGEGKLTSEVVTQALLKMSSTADAEFAKTDATIGQSLGMLSNAVTQFVGEAGKGSGAANLLSGSIQALAGNLDLIADTAVVGGVAYLTKTIVGQTIATQGAISASVARRASMLGELESVVQATTAEVSRTAAIAQLRNMQLADAQATAARMTGIQRLAYVQNTVIPLEAKATAATAAHTAAVEADTLAQNANSAARSRAAKLFTVLGGWTGVLTIGVAGLAAGYMYLKDRTAEANKKLEEQANVAKKAKDELIALKGLEKDSAINDMTAAFERQNKALAESSSRINMQLNAIEQLYKGNKEIVQVVQDARNGTISMSEAIQRFNELRISKEVYESIKANTAEFEKNAKEATNTKVKLNLFGIEVELSGRKAQTAALGVDEDTKALGKNETAADKAARAQKNYSAEIQKFIDKSFENSAKNSEMATLQLKGFNQETAELIAQAREAEGLTGTNKPLSMATFAAVTRELMTRRQALAVQEQQNKSEKERLAILEQQGKVLQVNSKVQANAAKYNFSQLESKYKLPSGTLSSIHMIESKGNAKAYNKTTGASGGFQFLKGTADQYGVKNRNDLAQSAEGAAKYMSYLLKLFKGDLEKAVRAYHAGEGNVQKGKNIGKYNNQYWKNFQGYMAGQSGLSFDAEFTVNDFEKILDDRSKLLVEQERREKQLLDDQNTLRGLYYDDWQKLEIDNQEKTKEINEKFASDPSERNRLLDLQKKAYEEDVGNWLKAQDQRYEAEQETNRQIIEARKAAFFAMSEPLGNMQAAGLNAMAQLNLSPLTYQRWQLNNQHQAGYSELADNLQASKDSINGNPDLSDTERYEQLTQAYEAYRQNKIALSQLYDQQELDLQNQQHAASLAGYGAMFGMMGSMLDAYGEKESTAYKLAFAMQKGFVLASAIMNAKGAIMAAWNDPTNVTIWQKMAGAAAVAVQTNDLMSAIQGVALTGFSSGGYTGPGGKYEPAGIVHKGEGVLSQEDMAAIGGPTGFMQLRQAIKGRGFSEGGLVSSYRSTDQMLAVQRETRQTNLVSSSSLPAPQINIEVINQASGVTVETEQISEREIRLIVRDEMPKAFEEQISNPNSRVSRAVSKNTTARRNR
ncbi:tape measure protein [Acinetobacter radioresistens]